MTYTNPIPANYNATTISVDTGELESAAASISTAVTAISNALIDINTQLKNLTLNWLGNAANAASSYNDDWNNVVQMLFGATDANGNSTGVNDGALSVLTSGLDQAITNYNANEAAVANLYNGFANPNPNAPAGPTTDQPTTPISNASGVQEYLYHTTAVNETT